MMMGGQSPGQSRPKPSSAAVSGTLFTPLHTEASTRRRSNSVSPDSSHHSRIASSLPGSNAHVPSFRRVSALLPHHQPPSPRKTQVGLPRRGEQQQPQLGGDFSAGGHAYSFSVPLRRLAPGMEHSGLLQRLHLTDEGGHLLLPSLSHLVRTTLTLTPASTPATPTATPTAPVDSLIPKQWHELSASTHFDTSFKRQVGATFFHILCHGPQCPSLCPLQSCHPHPPPHHI